MNIGLIGFVILLGVIILLGVMSCVRNFAGLLKLEKPTQKQINYNQNIAALTVGLFMFWIVLVLSMFN